MFTSHGVVAVTAGSFAAKATKREGGPRNHAAVYSMLGGLSGGTHKAATKPSQACTASFRYAKTVENEACEITTTFL